MAGTILILLAIAGLGTLAASALRSFDDDFCFTREDAPREWDSYVSSASIWPPGQECTYRLEDGSRLVLPPPSERVVPYLLGTWGLLLVFTGAYLTFGRSRAT